MDKPGIIYRPRPDATPEAELQALATVYEFIIESSQGKEKAAGTSGGEDDAKEIKNACTAKSKYTRT